MKQKKIGNYWMRLSVIWIIMQIEEGVIHYSQNGVVHALGVSVLSTTNLIKSRIILILNLIHRQS